MYRQLPVTGDEDQSTTICKKVALDVKRKLIEEKFII